MDTRHHIRETAERRRQRPLVLEVRDELERMILLGELRGGERLNEEALADLLGVSRGPVREAARSLEREGLVQAVANDGVYVRSLSVAEALELYDLRAMMAGYLCAALAGQADDALRAQLHGFLDRMDAAIASGDEAEYFALNLSFHDHIAETASAPRARALYLALGKEVRLMRLKVLTGPEALRRSNAEHAAIVAAIVAGDAEAARTAGAAHHANGKARLLDRLRQEAGGACQGPPDTANPAPKPVRDATRPTDLGRIT